MVVIFPPSNNGHVNVLGTHLLLLSVSYVGVLIKISFETRGSVTDNALKTTDPEGKEYAEGAGLKLHVAAFVCVCGGVGSGVLGWEQKKSKFIQIFSIFPERQMCHHGQWTCQFPENPAGSL